MIMDENNVRLRFADKVHYNVDGFIVNKELTAESYISLIMTYINIKYRK